MLRIMVLVTLIWQIAGMDSEISPILGDRSLRRKNSDQDNFKTKTKQKPTNQPINPKPCKMSKHEFLTYLEAVVYVLQI